MKRIKHTIYILMATLVCAVSCKKAEGPDLLLYVAPPVVQDLDAKETTVSVAWEYSPDSRVAGFVAQLSLDKNFATIFQSDTVDANARTADFENVSLVTEYFVRVRAIANNIVISSDFAAKSLKLESIFLPLSRADVKADQVNLKWTPPATGSVTSVVLISGGVAMAPLQLSAANISSNSVTVTGLSGATDYTALIYNGKERKGVVTFTTRDVNEKITINSNPTIYETLQDAVNAASSGDVITLGIANYDFTGLNEISGKSLTIKAAAGTGTPKVSCSGFVLKGAVASLNIQGIKFNITSGSYFITATEVIGPSAINIEKADISGPTAGLIYVASGGTAAVVDFTINNSIAHDFGATGGDFIDFRAGALKGIKITNSTFYKVARDFFRIDAAVSYATSNSPILVENCTFDNVCGVDGSQGRFFYVRVPKVNGYTMMVLNKCIMTNKVRSQGGGVTPIIESKNINVFGNASTEWLAGTVQSNITTLDPQYADVSKADYTVGNATLKAAGLGDPRWL